MRGSGRLYDMLRLYFFLLLLITAAADDICSGDQQQLSELSVCYDSTHVSGDAAFVSANWSARSQKEVDDWLANKIQLEGFSIKLQNTLLTHFMAPNLKNFDATLHLESNGEMESIELSSLERGDLLILKDMPKLKTIVLPKKEGATRLDIEEKTRNQLDRPTVETLRVVEGGKCSFPQDKPVYDTSDMNYCKFLPNATYFAPNATGGSIPFRIEATGCIHIINTSVSSLSFLSTRSTNCAKHEIGGNKWLCFEGFPGQAFKCQASNKPEICGIRDACTRVCRSPAEISRKGCWVYQGNVAIERGTEEWQMAQEGKDLGLREIEGGVSIYKSRLTQMDWLASLEKITAVVGEGVALEIVDNYKLDSIKLPNLKEIVSNGTTALKVKIRGNKYKMSREQVDRLLKRANLKEHEVYIEIRGKDESGAAGSSKQQGGESGSGQDDSTSEGISGSTIGLIVGCSLGAAGILLFAGFLLWIVVIKPRMRRRKKKKGRKDMTASISMSTTMTDIPTKVSAQSSRSEKPQSSSRSWLSRKETESQSSMTEKKPPESQSSVAEKTPANPPDGEGHYEVLEIAANPVVLGEPVASKVNLKKPAAV